MFRRAHCPTCRVTLPWLIFTFDRRVSRSASEVLFRCPSCQRLHKAEVNRAYRRMRALQVAVVIPVAVVCGVFSLSNADILPLFVYLAFALPWFLFTLVLGHHRMTFTKCGD